MSEIDLTTFDFKVGGLERSLAFTALHGHDVGCGDKEITAFLLAYARFLTAKGGQVKHGSTDMWSFARDYVKGL